VTTVLGANNAVVANDTTLSGTPALRITGNGVRFTNREAGRVFADTAQDSAIVILGSGVTITNLAGGIIRSASGSSNTLSAPTILGGGNADRVENAGTILGLIDLAGGDDIFVDLVTGSNLGIPEVRGGDGNDTYVLVPTNTISRTANFNGGAGTDSLIVEGADGNVSSFSLTDVENVVIRSSGGVEGIRGVDRIEFDMRGAAFRFNALRFTDSPDADVVIRQDDPSRPTSLSIYDRITLRSVLGSSSSDFLSVGNDTVVTGAIDLGGGNDSLSIVRSQFENPQQQRIGNAISGGAGLDSLSIGLRDGGIFDAANVSGFEILRLGYGGPTDFETIVRNIGGVGLVEAYQNCNVRLESAALAGVVIDVYGPARLTIDAASTVGGIFARTIGLGGGAIADDTRSITLTVQGNIFGTVQFSVGDDRLAGELSQSALVADGGAGNDSLTGGAFADRLVGSFGADMLVGGGGNDSLDGGSADDRLDGGTGDDLLIGGDGSDAYYVDSQGDIIVETSFVGGDDTAFSSASYYLYAYVDTLFLYDSAGAAFGVGNDLSNIIYGNAFANLLLGGANDDLWRE
jgi:hypothetical protein